MFTSFFQSVVLSTPLTEVYSLIFGSYHKTRRINKSRNFSEVYVHMYAAYDIQWPICNSVFLTPHLILVVDMYLTPICDIRSPICDV